MENITFIHLVVLGLGAFRLTRLMTTDVILNPVREWIWKKSPPSQSGIGYLITCDWCSGIWASSLLVVLYTISVSLAMTVGGVFALAALVGILTAHVEK